MTRGNAMTQFTELHNFYIIYIFKGRYVNSENFEIMSPPQKYFDYICGVFQNEMDKVLSDRIEANRKEYERLIKDDNYTDVRFNQKNGALAAIHKEHRFDHALGIFGIPRGDYERISLDVLYEYGNAIVLGAERSDYKIRVPEGLLNGKKFDIKGVEGIGKNNIINNFKDTNKKRAETIVLYYHDMIMFSEKQLQEDYQSYLRNSKSKRIQQVYYIIDRKLYALK